MLVSVQPVEVSSDELVAPDVLLASEQVLGNGTRDDLRDVVFVKPERFDPKFTRQIAGELDELNRRLIDEDRHYLLIGFGRWGSSDPWLGIPVEWGQISGARVIVETTLPEMNPDLSQGSHFFHNLISQQVLYLSLRHGGRFAVDWPWLERQAVVAETEFVKHVRCRVPLAVKVDGRGRKGVVTRGRDAQSDA